MPIYVPAPGASSPALDFRRTVVEFPGLTITGASDEIDPSGAVVHWMITALDGWDSPAPMSGGATDRPAQDGAWLTPSYRRGRTVAFEGAVLAPSREVARANLARLFAALPYRYAAPLTVTHDGEARRALVRVDGDTLSEVDRGVARFSVTLYAPDPRKFGTVERQAGTSLPSVSGGVTLPFTVPLVVDADASGGVARAVNNGDAPSTPVITVTGPAPPCTIRHEQTGRALRIPDAIDAGQTLTLDAATKTAFLNGNVPRVVTGSWFEIDPGVNDISFDAATYDAGAFMSVAYRDAYL